MAIDSAGNGNLSGAEKRAETLGQRADFSGWLNELQR